MFYSGRIQQFAQPELVCPIDNLKMKQKLKNLHFTTDWPPKG